MDAHQLASLTSYDCFRRPNPPPESDVDMCDIRDPCVTMSRCFPRPVTLHPTCREKAVNYAVMGFHKAALCPDSSPWERNISRAAASIDICRAAAYIYICRAAAYIDICRVAYIVICRAAAYICICRAAAYIDICRAAYIVICRAVAYIVIFRAAAYIVICRAAAYIVFFGRSL